MYIYIYHCFLSAQESAKALKNQLDAQKSVVEKLISNTRVPESSEVSHVFTLFKQSVLIRGFLVYHHHA
jgi:hypothetical protein